MLFEINVSSLFPLIYWKSSAIYPAQQALGTVSGLSEPLTKLEGGYNYSFTIYSK